RSQLMAEDRLDARFAELADRLHGFAEAQVARGDVSAAERAAELLAQLAGLDELFVRRAHCLREAVSAARQQARELAKEARHKLAQSDVGEAERLCAAAAALAGDLAEVRSLRAELADLGRQEAVLQRVAALADERDFGGAQQKLAELQSTPAL